MAKGEAVRDLSEPEIQKRLADARQELFTLRLQRTSGKLLNPAKILQTRRTVARLLTELRARELSESRDGAGRRAPAPGGGR
ncbi:MAG TPA: 50S ribosomal protein L29 [bacterium]|nr:50S ribosomal protein L29 [bacterium]